MNNMNNMNGMNGMNSMNSMQSSVPFHYDTVNSGGNIKTSNSNPGINSTNANRNSYFGNNLDSGSVVRTPGVGGAVGSGQQGQQGPPLQSLQALQPWQQGGRQGRRQGHQSHQLQEQNNLSDRQRVGLGISRGVGNNNNKNNNDNNSNLSVRRTKYNPSGEFPPVQGRYVRTYYTKLKNGKCRCNECAHIYDTPESMEGHIYLDHNNNETPFWCPICKKQEFHTPGGARMQKQRCKQRNSQEQDKDKNDSNDNSNGNNDTRIYSCCTHL